LVAVALFRSHQQRQPQQQYQQQQLNAPPTLTVPF
jgi:hypothetical protein